jgi:hypothetical protein
MFTKRAEYNSRASTALLFQALFSSQQIIFSLKKAVIARCSKK